MTHATNTTKTTAGSETKFYIAAFRVVATKKIEQMSFSADSYVSAQDHAAHIAGHDLNDHGGQRRVALWVRRVSR
jgi:environmental stress-induced protein Ves